MTTLILTIYLSTSLSTALSVGSTTDDSGIPTRTDKDLTLLTFITTLVYLYGLAFPAAFWGVVRYLALKQGGNEGGSATWSLAEAWAVWGYGMVVWVPISVSSRSRPIERGCRGRRGEGETDRIRGDSFHRSSA